MEGSGTAILTGHELANDRREVANASQADPRRNPRDGARSVRRLVVIGVALRLRFRLKLHEPLG